MCLKDGVSQPGFLPDRPASAHRETVVGDKTVVGDEMFAGHQTAAGLSLGEVKRGIIRINGLGLVVRAKHIAKHRDRGAPGS